jgi:hypothetical protein
VGSEGVLATIEGDSLEAPLPVGVGLLRRELLPDSAQELARTLRVGDLDHGINVDVIVAERSDKIKPRELTR